MSEFKPVPDSADIPAPGKLRTWWHPLLVNLLRHELGDSCEVLDEVNVGQLPLRLDVVLIRKGRKRLPQSAHEHLAALADRLNRYTLLELKSPIDSLDRTHLDRLLACAHLFRAQQKRPLKASELSLLILAPKLTHAFRGDLPRTRFKLKSEAPGAWRIMGTAFTTLLIETDILAGLGEQVIPGEPLLSFFSGVALRETKRIIQTAERRMPPLLLSYIYQQIQQFHAAGEEFAMRHAGTEYLDKTLDEFRKEFVRSLPPKDLLEGLSPEMRLDGLSPEERLVGLSPEERLDGLSPEERLHGLSLEERLDGLSPEERLKGLSPEEFLAGLSPEHQQRIMREILDRQSSPSRKRKKQ